MNNERGSVRKRQSFYPTGDGAFEDRPVRAEMVERAKTQNK